MSLSPSPKSAAGRGEANRVPVVRKVVDVTDASPVENGARCRLEA